MALSSGEPCGNLHILFLVVLVDRLRHSVIFFCMNCTQSFNYMNEVC